MFLQPREQIKAERADSEESFFGGPDIVLLNEKQWSYIQRRYHMSPRELQVARLVCRGLSNGDIANSLRVKPGTVKTHLRSIFNKTRVRNKISMLLRCVEHATLLYEDLGRTQPSASRSEHNPSGDGEKNDDT
jgi:DNA-binding NarL/FixJ family response regulator